MSQNYNEVKKILFMLKNSNIYDIFINLLITLTILILNIIYYDSIKKL